MPDDMLDKRRFWLDVDTDETKTIGRLLLQIIDVAQKHFECRISPSHLSLWKYDYQLFPSLSLNCLETGDIVK